MNIHQICFSQCCGIPLTMSGTPQTPTTYVQPYVDTIHIINATNRQITNSRPLNIRFACKRGLNAIDSSVEEIYQKIFNQTIQDKFTYQGTCGSTEVVGPHCGNGRDQLNECRCGPLDRFSNSNLRRQYEDQIIQTVLRIFRNSPFNNFNIAVFASGGLHGELVLMVRLIKSLKDAHFQGIINVFLIDQIYQQSIGMAHRFTVGPKPCSFDWVNFLGGRQDLAQFLKEVTYGLPPTIEVQGAVFGSDQDYITRAQCDANYRFDLLVGADTEDDGSVMAGIKRGAKRRDLPGIYLAKFNDIPQVCEVDDNGITKPCTRIF